MSSQEAYFNHTDQTRESGRQIRKLDGQIRQSVGESRKFGRQIRKFDGQIRQFVEGILKLDCQSSKCLLQSAVSF